MKEARNAALTPGRGSMRDANLLRSASPSSSRYLMYFAIDGSYGRLSLGSDLFDTSSAEWAFNLVLNHHHPQIGLTPKSS